MVGARMDLASADPVQSQAHEAMHVTLSRGIPEAR